MATRPDSHSDHWANAQEIVNELSCRINDRRGSFRVGELIASTLVDNQGTRRKRCGDCMCIIRQACRLVLERGQHAIGPPTGTFLGVLKVLTLTTQSGVSVRTQALYTTTHRHGKSNAGIEETSSQCSFTKSRAASDANLLRVDLRSSLDQSIENSVESPCPSSENAW